MLSSDEGSPSGRSWPAQSHCWSTFEEAGPMREGDEIATSSNVAVEEKCRLHHAGSKNFHLNALKNWHVKGRPSRFEASK